MDIIEPHPLPYAAEVKELQTFATLTARLAALPYEGPYFAWDSQAVQNLAKLYNVVIRPDKHDASPEVVRIYVSSIWFWGKRRWPLSHWFEAIARNGL